VLQTKNAELRAVATLCFVEHYWGRRGYTALERRYSELLVRQWEEKSKGALTTLNRMVIIPEELNMDHLKFHLITESCKKMEKNGIKESEVQKRR
jgi:Lhr-like helicase